MTVDEVKKSIEELKAQGWDEEEILGSFYAMFQDKKIDINELEALCGVIGYSLTEEFKNMSPEDQLTKGYEEVDENLDKEDIEAVKEVPEPEKDKKDEGPEKDEKSEEDDNEVKARKLFGYDN